MKHEVYFPDCYLESDEFQNVFGLIEKEKLWETELNPNVKPKKW
ncbi:hypothetical protein R84B8_02198 [Treponema sp. R8-4-B8]